jgi:SAM-dependent methyltransferase
MSSCHTACAGTPYPLLRDEAEHERLQAQSRFWSADAGALFDSAGIGAGWRVADLGCGTLDVAMLLAQRVGPRGSVCAVDNDTLLMRRLQPVARALAGVRLLEGDAWATGWPDGSFDAVHARFLAAPAGRLDALVAEMRRLLRPGGVVMMQEPDADSWALPQAGDAWLRLRRLIRAGFERRGGCFDAGRELLAAFARHGLVAAEERRVVRRLAAAHVYSALPLAFARQLRPLLVEHGLAREEELDALVREVGAALVRGGETETFTLVQAWARVAPA